MNALHGGSLRGSNISSRSLIPQFSCLKLFKPNFTLSNTIRCNVHTSIDSCPTLGTYKLRQVTADDVAGTASVCLEAFGSKDGARFRTVAQWEKQLTGAVAGKKLAREEARLDRYLAQNETIKGQLSTLQGYSSNPRSKKREEVEEKARQRLNYRRRSFYCCVAQDRTSSQIIGCVAVTLARPEAVLPPPFPTTARLRCYISNIAVSPAHRRQGVATAMINKCERIARLWGQTAVFLHVEIQNEAAESLYRGLGYQQVPWIGTSSLPWKGKQRTILMMKELRPLPKRKNLYLNLDNNGSNSTETSGSTSSDSGVESSDGEGKSNAGVFVWNVKEVVEVEEEENATNCE